MFVEITFTACNRATQQFLDLCAELGFPVSMGKTEWACKIIVFLGILLDGKRLMLAIPDDKSQKALNQLYELRDKRTIKVHKVEALMGLLNFLNRAVVPECAFTPRLYSKFTGKTWLNNGQ